MGVDLSKIVQKSTISLKDLSSKTLAVDAYNAIYQFLATIRDYRGQPLRDRRGMVTSHLSGLFYRNINLLAQGIKLMYVFDGTPPLKKKEELDRRKRQKEKNKQKYQQALFEGKYIEAKRYATATAHLDDFILRDSKKLLKLMGIGVIDAPAEGEAQASYMVKKGDVWACASQDYDAILFASPKVLRNVTLTARRSYPSKNMSIKLEPELIELDQILLKYGITREQLVDVGILVGTDFNNGVRGIGAVKALQLVKKHGAIEEIPTVKDTINLDEINEVRQIFLHPNITNDYRISDEKIDGEGMINFLCNERDFSRDRILKALEKIDHKTS